MKVFETWNLFGILKLAGDRRCHNFAKKTLVIESGVIKGVTGHTAGGFSSSVCFVVVGVALAVAWPAVYNAA